MQITCTKCGETKPADEFGPDKRATNGRKSGCRACARARYQADPAARAKAIASAAKYIRENREHVRTRNAAYRAGLHGAVAMFNHAKFRARLAGVPFEIAKEDIIIPTHCPLLGMPLVRTTGFRSPGSPSLDRIEPSKGYVKGNIWVISYRANQIKNGATLAELETLVTNLRVRTSNAA